MSLSLSDLLKRMLEMNGSDLHITTNSPPQIRVHGHLVPLDLPQLTPAETKQLAYSVMTDSQKHRFEEHLELDFSFGLKGLARFRANTFNQRGATSAVFRVIPFEIKNFNQLGLPAVVTKLCEKPRGLVLPTLHRPPSTESLTFFRRTSSRRSGRNCRWFWKALCVKAFCRKSTGKAAPWPWKFSFRMQRSAT
jgi:Tfp pilus assembly ATPase PilU